jgi:macrolide transport system ATP-binding/permease protein
MKNKSKKEINTKEKNIKGEIMILENQISSLLGKISIEQNEDKKAEYDKEYTLKLKELEKLYKR